MFTINLKSILVTFTIALSLARRILRIVIDNKKNQLQELKDHLLKRDHPEKNN